MKNISKTIFVWLLTAIIGGFAFGVMLAADESGHTGRFALNDSDMVVVSAIAAVACLALSIPATILYHFIAIRLYQRWDSTTKIKAVLGLYAAGATVVSIDVLGISSDGRLDTDFFILAVPFAIGALVSALLFSYRPLPKEQRWGSDSSVFPDEEEAEAENLFPKETHAIIICITVLMILWDLINMIKGKFYGGGFNIGFSVLLLGTLIAGMVLFARKNVTGWYLLFGFFVYGSVSTLLSVLNVMGRYRATISGQYMIQTILMLVICNLAPLILIAAPKMTHYFKVEKNKTILVCIIAGLLVAGVWVRFWMM
ncbi:hypothetical protein [Taibaiella soli]|uniref:Uncharacterized protein n=1 Tax=Taibaiella soli TaxID=1649169 RepID=A0A2W2ATP8_9BACT|nr:hypothetical protein [Taibaiella soli]PZF71078.1 hypothetical protein DN068_20485 [Taibaiella soli]